MPTLKDLVCHVQWADTGSPFPEHGTLYGDGVVETYIAIPTHPQAFTIRLTSRKFIFQGLAMVVFIDGNYQCNRNRVNLLPPKKNRPRDRTEVDFLVRQKEKPMGDGTYMGREWRFDDYNIVPQLPPGVDQSHFNELGTIEVLVLRCRSDNQEGSQVSTTSSGEDSTILADDGDDEEQNGNGLNKSSHNEGHSTKADEGQTEPEPGPFGGLFGIFDGPADQPPLQNGIQGHAPSDGYHAWGWQQPGARPAPYKQQEGPSHPQVQRPGPAQYEGTRRTYTYHDSPPPSAYAHPGFAPPRLERRVHFDYGDGRGPHHKPIHMRYDDRSLPGWRSDDGYWRPRAVPSYQDSRHHGGFNPYADYPIPPESGHYIYQTDREAYSENPTSNQPHVSYQPGFPSEYAHPAVPPHRSAFPSTGVSISSFPPAPPNPPTLATGQTQPFYHHIPVWIPPTAISVPANFPGAIPIWPPASNASLFQTQRPGEQASGPSSGPSGQEAPQSGLDPAKEENNTSNTVQWNDPPQDSINNNSSDDWASNAAGGRRNPGSGSDNNNDNDNSNADWAAGADTNDNNGGNDNNDDWAGNNNVNSNIWGNNNNYNNGNDNQGGWNNGVNNDSQWDLNDQNQNHNGDQQGKNGSRANYESANGGNDQSNTWNNDQNNTTNFNTVQTPIAGQSNIRALYGPHGAYYASKIYMKNAVPPDAEEEPRYDVPQAVAQTKGITKQVHPGKGYIYSKKRCVPEYVDNLDDPYARFVFKYRTKEQLKKEIGVEISTEPTANGDINALENLDKAELIQMVLRAKGALGGTIPSPPPNRATPASTNSFEQVPVEAPELGYLRYNLPPTRPVPNPGLGIRIPNTSSNQNSSGGNNSNQNNDWRNGQKNWQDNNQQDSNGGNNQNWCNDNWGQPNDAGNNNSGWDGQQEKVSQAQQPRKPSFTSPPSRKFSVQSQGTVRNNGVQAGSRRSSAVSPKGGTWANPAAPSNPSQAQPFGAGKTSDEMYEAAFRNTGAAGMGPPPPPPPPMPVSFFGGGVVGGGQTDMGAGPRPPTPTGPPPPCSPSENNGGWLGGAAAAAPGGGW